MTSQDGLFSTSDGCTISYTLQGVRSGRAPRLALIHSLALDRSVWEGVVERLGNRAEVLTYDARGHGRSGRPHMVYTSELFARDLAKSFHAIRCAGDMPTGVSGERSRTA